MTTTETLIARRGHWPFRHIPGNVAPTVFCRLHNYQAYPEPARDDILDQAADAFPGERGDIVRQGLRAMDNPPSFHPYEPHYWRGRDYGQPDEPFVHAWCPGLTLQPKPCAQLRPGSWARACILAFGHEAAGQPEHRIDNHDGTYEWWLTPQGGSSVRTAAKHDGWSEGAGTMSLEQGLAYRIHHELWIMRTHVVVNDRRAETIVARRHGFRDSEDPGFRALYWRGHGRPNPLIARPKETAHVG